MRDSGQTKRDAWFEVFKVGPDESLHKVGDAESFNAAMWDAEIAAIRAPGKYVLLNRSTGERDVLNLELGILPSPGKDP
jgi:hypothetical protein